MCVPFLTCNLPRRIYIKRSFLRYFPRRHRSSDTFFFLPLQYYCCFSLGKISFVNQLLKFILAFWRNTFAINLFLISINLMEHLLFTYIHLLPHGWWAILLHPAISNSWRVMILKKNIFPVQWPIDEGALCI